jgi:hypothetical protein
MIWPTQVDKVELFAHHIIHFETYAEDDSQTDSCESLYKASNSHAFASIWLESSGKLLTSRKAQNMAWHDMTHPGEQSRTVWTSHYPFWEPCRGQWTVQQQWIDLQGFKQSHFCNNYQLLRAVANYWPVKAPKTWHDIKWPKWTIENCLNITLSILRPKQRTMDSLAAVNHFTRLQTLHPNNSSDAP